MANQLMYPYTGINVLFIVLVVVAALIAAVALFFMLKIEKQEKQLDGTDAKKKRFKKYGVFAVFFIALGAAAAIGINMNSWSLAEHRDGVVAEIEQTGATIVEGFESPDIPLEENSHAKFVVETESGIVRCRAIAEGASTQVSYKCQDGDKEFTIPLNTLTKADAND